MNEANVDALIAHLESCPDDSFSMNKWISSDIEREALRGSIENPPGTVAKFVAGYEFPEGYCGTACCVAGHCFELIPVEDRRQAMETLNVYATFTPAGPLVARAARLWLGLTCEEADDLFTPPKLTLTYPASKYTRERALETLKRFRNTGIAEWRV